jgi:hypothetical protein
MDFLVGIFYINGHGFRMAKPNGFVPFAIFTPTPTTQKKVTGVSVME